MKWEYFGTGLAFAGIGITLMLALPPPWWPKMPPPLVHIGVILGIMMTIVGAMLSIYGFWPTLPNPKAPVFGMGISAILFIGCFMWFWIAPEKTFSLEETLRLKRLIAYIRLDPRIPGGTDPLFHGYIIGVANVSDDTITARLMFVRVNLDDAVIMSVVGTNDPVIIPQTQAAFFENSLPNDVPISANATMMTVEFEVDYNTIPETGVRKSYRRIAYPLNWANGKNRPPLLDSPRTLEEWEK